MENTEIDTLTQRFYQTISFTNRQLPEQSDLQSLFYGSGLMINNSFASPVAYTAETYVNAVESQIANDDLRQYQQWEISSHTEVFGKIAQRISVYEYTMADVTPQRPPRGVNYIQYIKIETGWRMVSMNWNDESELYLIPEQYITPNNTSLESEYIDS